MIISKNRKEELEDLADLIATEDCDETIPVDVVKIAKDRDITFCMGDYQDYFDGMLEYEEKHFHIYLNNQGKFPISTPRIRFSFAHELGHYFIDEHRLLLESGRSLHHPSKYAIIQKDPVEQEADLFASCLLMPRSLFEADCNYDFDFELIDELRKKYCTSIPATIFRYMDFGEMPLAIVCARNSVIQYCSFSDNFPYKKIKTNYTKKIPLLTCAGDFFENGVVCDETEKVEAKEWFTTYDDLRGVILNEHCVYQKVYNQTLSILWFD